MVVMSTSYPSDWLGGAVAIVTGGGRGIGAGVARAMARCGAAVVVAGRDEAKLDETAARIQADGGRSRAVKTDVRDAEAVERLIATTEREFGRLDVLVNNAGGQFLAPALDISPNGWRSVVDLNLNGTFYCCRYAAEPMMRSGGGSIVNIAASSMVEVSAAGRAHSGAARAGVANLTRTLAVEWGARGVRVNAIGVGVVVTPGMEEEFTKPGILEEVLAGTPQRRLCTLEDVANLVLFLASDAAGHVTGEWVNLDGGMRLVESVTWVDPDDG
jgi:hypothetical protein